MPTPTTFLLVDAMYFHAAMQNLAYAVGHQQEIDSVEAKLRQLEYEIDEVEVEDEYGNTDADKYKHFERLAIQIEDAEYDVGVAYGPYLQALAITHILCAASLESHINIRAKELLDGKAQHHFERISHEAKWLFLPHLIGLSGFDPGQQPYQGFSKLITIRNKLIHYQFRKEKWRIRDSVVPTFIDELGLSETAATASIETVRGMVRKLAEQLSEEEPFWIRVNNIGYFGFDIE